MRSPLISPHTSSKRLVGVAVQRRYAVPDFARRERIHGAEQQYLPTLRGKELSFAWRTMEECLAIAAGSVEYPKDCV